MTRNRGVLAVALIIAVMGLSIGFAAFSNILTIKTSVTVTPDSSVFVVKFSKVSNADQTGSSYPITPIIAQGSDATGENGTIDSTNPLLLTGLHANFTEPGQSVSYKLYVRNTGSYTAYLTNLDFKDIAGGESFIACGGDVTSALKTAACDDITVTVRIGGTDGVGGTAFTSRDLDVTNELSQVSLASGSSTEVYVTISYANNGNYPDGLMSVTFGDIMMQYRSIDTPLAIPDPEVPTPQFDDLIPTSTELTAASPADVQEGISNYIFVDGVIKLHYVDGGESPYFGGAKYIILYADDNLTYIWACDSTTTTLIGAPEANQWYVSEDDGETLEEYNGAFPVDLEEYDLEELDIKSESYAQRVIASFGSN